MNEKITADTYDRGIIPAETAARMKRGPWLLRASTTVGYGGDSYMVYSD